MSDEKDKDEVHELAGGWITERKGTPIPAFLKLSYVGFCLFGLVYLVPLLGGRGRARDARPAGAGQINTVMDDAGRPPGIAVIAVCVAPFAARPRSGSRSSGALGGLSERRRPVSSAYRRLRIPDAERYWVEQVKCRVGCPVFTDACGYVTAVAEGRDDDAYAIARATNPFVSICGRICGAPCERACRRGSVDAPVSIRAIKRWACELYGNETGSDAALPPLRRRADAAARGATTRRRSRWSAPGVAGLTVAHDLARAGYKVTVFEAGPVAGRHADPRRAPLPAAARARASARSTPSSRSASSCGCNAPVGRPRPHARATCGARASRRSSSAPASRAAAGSNIPGADLPGVVNGLEFLKLVNLGRAGRDRPPGGRDRRRQRRLRRGPHRAARATEDEEAEDFRVTADVARTAARRRGVTEVHVACLESLEEMPADAHRDRGRPARGAADAHLARAPGRPRRRPGARASSSCSASPSSTPSGASTRSSTTASARRSPATP